MAKFPSGQIRLHLLVPVLENDPVPVNAVNKAHIDDVAAVGQIKAR